MLDHSASPGIPETVALRMGLNPREVSEGRTAEMVTLSCRHCGGCWVANPDRIRERGYCRTCDHYLCDGCKAASLLPNYVHTTREDRLNAAIAGRSVDTTSVSIFVP